MTKKRRASDAFGGAGESPKPKKTKLAAARAAARAKLQQRARAKAAIAREAPRASPPPPSSRDRSSRAAPPRAAAAFGKPPPPQRTAPAAAFAKPAALRRRAMPTKAKVPSFAKKRWPTTSPLFRQAKQPSFPAALPAEKSLRCASILWLLSLPCNLHLHLLYLGRYFHWALAVLSCGGCGVGCMADRMKLETYVAERHVDDDFVVYTDSTTNTGLTKSSTSVFFNRVPLTPKASYGMIFGALLIGSLCANAGWHFDLNVLNWGKVDTPPSGVVPLLCSSLMSLLVITMLLRVGPRSTTRSSLVLGTLVAATIAHFLGRVLECNAVIEIIPLTLLLCCRTRTWTAAELGRMREGDDFPASFGDGSKRPCRHPGKWSLLHMATIVFVTITALMRSGSFTVDGQSVNFYPEGVWHIYNSAFVEGRFFSSAGRLPECHRQARAHTFGSSDQARHNFPEYLYRFGECVADVFDLEGDAQAFHIVRQECMLLVQQTEQTTGLTLAKCDMLYDGPPDEKLALKLVKKVSREANRSGLHPDKYGNNMADDEKERRKVRFMKLQDAVGVLEGALKQTTRRG